MAEPKKLTSRTNTPFKLSLEVCLDNKYCFSKLKAEHLRILDNFLAETVGKNLTVSEAERLFLRTRGPKETACFQGETRTIYHYGKDKKSFRIHGYNNNGYFVITKIDPNHKVHK
ncbi:TPA_asm: hypothetical protein GI736_01540 [Listeria monocytogenes]|uniref:MAG6450 family protein n=1 Tax=Listeria monocytogenes TaxID=1639 RepID=UPI0007E2E30E|nr:hypothetical protein [Listeria monocytogenes]HBM3560230.1 hypothetical protein [Listeria innocua]EHJ4943328.1 hypothetical protein [Listeria monocytogenes]EHJ4968540.1 hypothetical protein [Listeria monocytogenes]MCI2611356.1 hypothetical protein [Listeria monocytogenes]MCI2640485.1 hypothetical protein [Listeria monocytogenes]